MGEGWISVSSYCETNLSCWLTHCCCVLTDLLDLLCLRRPPPPPVSGRSQGRRAGAPSKLQS